MLSGWVGGGVVSVFLTFVLWGVVSPFKFKHVKEHWKMFSHSHEIWNVNLVVLCSVALELQMAYTSLIFLMFLRVFSCSDKHPSNSLLFFIL